MLIVYVVNYGICDGGWKSKTHMNKLSVFSTLTLAEAFIGSTKNIEYDITEVKVDDIEEYYFRE